MTRKGGIRQLAVLETAVSLVVAAAAAVVVVISEGADVVLADVVSSLGAVVVALGVAVVALCVLDGVLGAVVGAVGVTLAGPRDRAAAGARTGGTNMPMTEGNCVVIVAYVLLAKLTVGRTGTTARP